MPHPSNIPLEKLKYLPAIISEINGLLPLDRLLEKIVNQVTKAIDAEASSLLLIDEHDPDSVFFKISTGSKAEEVKKFRLKIGQGIAGTVIESGKPILANDLSKEKHFYRKVQDTVKYENRNILCVPLIYREQVLGALQLLNKKNGQDFSEEDLALLQLFAIQASIALATAKHFKQKDSQIKTLKSHIKDLQKPPELVGKCLALQNIQEIIRKIAPTDAKVLITGESGTGKEVVARQIHFHSARNEEPFVAINCAAIPHDLIESELFGYEKGAFTGAGKKKKGKFEQANGGTLFLDEIAEMPIELQAKLLRAIQFGQIEKVGATSPTEIDVRIIAATNADIETQIQNKNFREDLYYRLNVIPIHLPTLRKRKEDLRPLVKHFLTLFRERGIEMDDFSIDHFLKTHAKYDWPGNIRELENILEREIILASTNLNLNPGKTMLPTNTQQTEIPSNIPLKEAVESFRKQYFLSMKEKHSDIKTLAEHLQVSTVYVRNLIKKYSV